LYRVFKRGTLKDPEHKAKYGKIYIVYKDEKSVIFESIVLGRKWIFGVVLVLFYNHEAW
jgi:hypothetical protein